MYLSKFRLFNYKSFQDSGLLEFKPGINIIVGTNNSGKTALVEGLSLNIQSQIHKSLATFPFSSGLVDSSGYELFLNVEKKIILNLINNIYKSGKTLLIPVSNRYANYDKEHENDFLTHTIPEILKIENIEDIENIEIQIRFISPRIIPFDNVFNLFSLSYSTPIEKIEKKDLNILNVGDTHYYGITNINEEGRGKFGSFIETIQYQIFQEYRLSVYKFNAERKSLATSQVGTSRILHSDASNLAEVLLNLQGNNPSLFEEFNQYVSRVIPTIKRISVSCYDNTTVQIKVWTSDLAIKREDLAYPLSDCGSGVSQVLAILYVVISKESQVIIIDEPQAFLHPEAARKLIEILKEFPQHQYFISTHSPATITAANPSTIVKLSHDNNETKVLMMNPENVKEQRDLLSELGVSLSDVFGADSILWVEGPTEERCFPMILEKIAKKPQRGIQILAVKNTGDLEGKRAELIFDIYDKLSGGTTLFPPAIGFIFDCELREDPQKNELKKRSQKPVYFLKWRMYENYLLHPKAIAAVINAGDENRSQPLCETRVQQWIDDAKKEDYYLPKNNKLLDLDWWGRVDGAKLLLDLFSDLSEGRLPFRKTKHSPEITKWLIENEPEQLSELGNFLARCLDENTK